MSDRQPSQGAQTPEKAGGQATTDVQEPQPESGFIDQEDRLEMRQSSPTNPRVSDKPAANQEEA